jgi:hypothetical protein
MSEVLHGIAFRSDVADVQATTLPFNVRERAELAVATFSDLGLLADKAQATDHFGQQMRVLAETVRDVESDVEPFISVDLNEAFTLSALLAAFDSRQAERSNVYDPLWSQYTSSELNVRTVDSKPIPVGDTAISGSARAMVLGASNDYQEIGLHFTGKIAKDQRSAVKGSELITPADYIILMAQRRQAGGPSLDTQTFTRFVQLEAKRADGCLWTPYASLIYGQLGLGGSDDYAYSLGGVRLSVGPKA